MGKVSEKEVLDLIEKALKLGSGKLTVDSSSASVEEWDSLGHLSVLMALDKFFEGKAAGVKGLASADSVKEIIKLLKENSLI